MSGSLSSMTSRLRAGVASLRQLGGQDLGLEDLWWPVKESFCIGQQGRGDRALQVRLAFTVGRKRIDDPEGGRVRAQREPGDGALLLVGESEGVGEEGADLIRLIWLGHQLDD